MDGSSGSNLKYYQAIPSTRGRYGVVLVHEDGTVLETLPVSARSRAKALTAAANLIRPPKPAKVSTSAQEGSPNDR